MDASTGPPTRAGASALRHAHTLFQGACLVLVGLLIVVRIVRYVLDDPVPGIDHLLGTAMILDTQTFLWFWAYTFVFASILLGTVPLWLPVVLLVAWVARLRRWRLLARLRDRLVRREGGRWRLQPLGVSALCFFALWVHFLFDANPFMGLVCGSSLGIAVTTSLRRDDRAAPALRWWMAVAWTAFFGFCVAMAWDHADQLAVLAWGLFFLVALYRLPRFLGVREIRWLLVLGIPVANLLPAFLPLAFPLLHGGQPMGPGLVYSFCEVPKHGKLFASQPNCSSIVLGNVPAACGDGRILEYDPQTLQRVARHRFFSADFSGRFEQLVCLEDEVYVAMQSTWDHGQIVGQSALTFRAEDPRQFRTMVAGTGVGSNVAYDPWRDALFYVGEFTGKVLRYDRRTDVTWELHDPQLERTWINPIEFKRETGSFGLSSDPSADRLYIYEFHQGRYTFALDPGSLQVVQRYAVNSGAGWGITTDPQRSRFVFSNTWGLDVIDRETGRKLARRRLGLGTKRVVLDEWRNLLYVPSTVDGKLRVLDRDTLELVAQIPIGFGTRYPYLTRDAGRLLASSFTGHYAWYPGVIRPGNPPQQQAEAADAQSP